MIVPASTSSVPFNVNAAKLASAALVTPRSWSAFTPPTVSCKSTSPVPATKVRFRFSFATEFNVPVTTMFPATPPPVLIETEAASN